MNKIFILQFFKLNKLLINEAEDTIEAGIEEESKVANREYEYTMYKCQRKVAERCDIMDRAVRRN